jgi:hypothetical protein
LSDDTPALILLSASFLGLYVYGVVLLRRMAVVVKERTGRAATAITSPLSAPWLPAAYRSLWDEDDGLPRWHRSLRLDQFLLVVVLVSSAGVVIRAALG